MVPWPIAILVVCYGVVAAASGATMWRALIGVEESRVLWLGICCGLSSALVVGLALLKPWARSLAIASSWILILVSLAVAGRYVLATRPGAALLTTCVAGLHMVVIRYLRRVTVKNYFNEAMRFGVRPRA